MGGICAVDFDMLILSRQPSIIRRFDYSVPHIICKNIANKNLPVQNKEVHFCKRLPRQITSNIIFSESDYFFSVKDTIKLTIAPTKAKIIVRNKSSTKPLLKTDRNVPPNVPAANVR